MFIRLTVPQNWGLADVPRSLAGNSIHNQREQSVGAGAVLWLHASDSELIHTNASSPDRPQVVFVDRYVGVKLASRRVRSRSRWALGSPSDGPKVFC